MGEDKVDVLLRVCETNLSRAEKRFAEGEYDSGVFHASLAVENAANAMILLLGGDEAWGAGSSAGHTGQAEETEDQPETGAGGASVRGDQAGVRLRACAGDDGEAGAREDGFRVSVL